MILFLTQCALSTRPQLQKCAGGQKEPLAHTVIHGAISGLITWFIEMTEVLEPSDFDSGANSNNIWSGLEFVGTLGARCKVTSENISDFRANLDRCINLAKEVCIRQDFRFASCVAQVYCCSCEHSMTF